MSGVQYKVLLHFGKQRVNRLIPSYCTTLFLFYFRL